MAHPRSYPIEYYINHMTKLVCPPYECPEQNYHNSGEVIHWTFQGDGTGDFEEYGNWAKKSVVEAYLELAKEQVTLAEEYLKDHPGDDNG